jgi:hypothetical protein
MKTTTKKTKTTPQSKPLVKLEESALDALKEVWYFAMIQGATLWGYSQEKKRNLPKDFTKGLDAISKQITDLDTLRYLLSTTPILLGLFDEALDGVMTDKDQFNKMLSTDTSLRATARKASVKKPTSLKKVK